MYVFSTKWYKNMLVEHMNKRDALHNKIASVNDKLKKARADVK